MVVITVKGGMDYCGLRMTVSAVFLSHSQSFASVIDDGTKKHA